MATISYIEPITNRTHDDVVYARSHQDDLEHKNIGAWNYTDINRICNNLKYAAEIMCEKGFMLELPSWQIKTDWKETDIITYEQLNSMIINNMNLLKSYARTDIYWYNITSIANMDYSLANWIERNIDALVKQEPLPADTYDLTVENGTGSGQYEAGVVVSIQAHPAKEGEIFSYWTGDHLENIGDPTAMITTYKMPRENIRLRANYTGITPHNITVKTHTKTEYDYLLMGDVLPIEADPAPQGKVFHHWEVEPAQYEGNLYEPAATTTFTMPNEEVTLTAVYITKGKKQLIVSGGKGSGWYEYGEYVSISSDKPEDGTFVNWSGDTQYLMSSPDIEYNTIKIPDQSVIRINAHWSTPPVPPTPLVENVKLTMENGIIGATGETEGYFTEGSQVSIVADPAPQGYTFKNWEHTGGGKVLGTTANATFEVGKTDATVKAIYRELVYHALVVETNSGVSSQVKEQYEYFEVDANPAPENYTFDKWIGDTESYLYSMFSSFKTWEPKTGTFMGESDRHITATYRPINEHTLLVNQQDGTSYTVTQKEFTTVNITALDAPEGQRFVRWNLQGSGTLSSHYSKNVIYTFGNGNAEITPVYSNIWTITVNNGTIGNDKKESVAILDEGETYYLVCRRLEVYEKFDGWTLIGPGEIKHLASPVTEFTVGEGNAMITANISQYPDKTLSMYKQDPDTGETSLISTQSYTYGSNIEIIAPVAPNKTTFASWLGDIETITPSALASTATVTMDKDIAITATYFYPEAPQYFVLNVHDGYPEEGSYATGEQVPIRAREPNTGWEFYKWYGDVQFLVNQDLSESENAVIMPLQNMNLYAKFKVIGETPLYRVSVTNGLASGEYIDDEGIEHVESGVYIDVPAGTLVTLTADPDTTSRRFDHWKGNFESAGVTDVITTQNPTTFTMVEHDLNIDMVRVEKEKYTVYTTNAMGPGENYIGTYTIFGTLQDTDDVLYTFENWTCVDADGNDCIDAIADPEAEETEITLTDRSLWITANYISHYKLTVIDGQDDGDGYYYEGEIVKSVYANDPPEGVILYFDHWDDPMGVVKNIYSKRPTITMKNSVATITAVFSTQDRRGNSIVITGSDIHTGVITRDDSVLINGVYAIGTLVFDKDGCIGVITEVDVDLDEDTDDYGVEKLFYGGNA